MLIHRSDTNNNDDPTITLYSGMNIYMLEEYTLRDTHM